MSRLQKGRSAALGQVQHIPGKSSPAVSKRLKKNTDILQQKSTKRWRPRSFLASEAQRGVPDSLLTVLWSKVCSKGVGQRRHQEPARALEHVVARVSTHDLWSLAWFFYL